MSSLSAFLDRLRVESALQEGLSAVCVLPEGERLAAFCALSREFGVPVSEADLEAALSGGLSDDLSEADLAGVSGGVGGGVYAAADDEVSAAVAALFSSHGQPLQSASGKASAVHDEFVRRLRAGGGS